jgi:hypothetical protein
MQTYITKKALHTVAWRPQTHCSHNARGKHHRAVLEKESGMDEQMSQAAGSSVEMPVVNGGKLSHPTQQWWVNQKNRLNQPSADFRDG